MDSKRKITPSPWTHTGLLRRVEKLDNGCWRFTGSIDSYGYGRIFHHGKEYKAHKVFFEEWHGPLPARRYLHHTATGCIGSACCNPDHMSIGTKRREVRELPTLPRILTDDRRKAEAAMEAERRHKELMAMLESLRNSGVKSDAIQVVIDKTGVVKKCPKGHLLAPGNIVTEYRRGKPFYRCRQCRRESWKKNSARRKSIKVRPLLI